MNDDRTQRRVGILVDMFYAAKTRHHATETPLKPGRFDNRDMAELMAVREQATFDEVKAALVWVFVTDRSRYWANALPDLGAFLKSYRTICDQLDAHMPAAPQPAAVQGLPRDGADHIRAQAEQPAPPVLELAPSPHVDTELEATVHRIAERKKLKPRKDLD